MADLHNRLAGITLPDRNRIEQIKEVALNESFATYAWWVAELQLLLYIETLHMEMRAVKEEITSGYPTRAAERVRKWDV